ncbi:hypothetical protein ETI09_03430 [Macrococcoides canis]|uniref:hypothetical protein n=1 Tax=Macrococcoides canis TaxID=1855823 RepID=UPI00105FD721|nr:hypothetical protein [Macrococcus canis]TDM43436.1 hypothetical protein ETI09_03430 [Macrococcus canis]
MEINSIKTKDSFHNYVTIKQSDNTSPIEVLLCDSKGALLSNLNEDCTVSIYDAISKEVRQISEEKINNGVLSFRITNDLFPYTHKLEVTTYSGVKFPADNDFQIFVSESHNSKLLNIIKSIPTELALKIVTQQVMDRFNTADENFRILSESMSAKINEISGSLLSYIKKGEVSVSDIDFNKGKLDGNAFADSFLNELGNGNIVTTSLLDGSVTTNKLADLAVSFSKLNTDAKDKIEIQTLLRDYLYKRINAFQYPENNTHFTTYATITKNPYYHSFMGSLTSPNGSLDSLKSNLIAANGYFFYRVKITDVFLSTKKVSILLRNTNSNTLVQYRFFDNSNQQIGNMYDLPRFNQDVYVVENVNIPTNASYIELRVDNRNVSNETRLIKPIVSPYPKVIFPIDDIEDVKNRTNSLELSVEQLKNKELGNKLTLPQPLGFNLDNYELKGRLFLSIDGNYITDYDVEESKIINGVTYYVDFVNGSDDYDGLSQYSPFKSMVKAFSMVNLGEIKVKGGKHFRYNTFWPANFNKAINITSYDGIAQLIMADRLEWTKTSGYTNVYQIARARVGKVVDLSVSNSNGYLEFKKKLSIADVDSEANTWFIENDIVYAHYKSQPKSDELVALLLSDPLRITSNISYFFLQDIEIIGGNRPFRSESEVIKLYAKNTKFLHSSASNGNGVEIVGGISAIFQECVAEHNNMDGFNYHQGLNGSKPYILELSCIGSNNGGDKGSAGSKSNNGSTAHDGIKIIRIKGLYAFNDGGNVADVNSGTQSWNLGVRAFDSYQGYDFLTSTGAKMWLDGCIAYGSTSSVSTMNIEDIIYIRNGQLQNINPSQNIQMY